MSAPTDDPVTRLWRFGYRLLYWSARAWWFVRRPRTRGAVVALWHDGRVLLMRSSYRSAYGLPGGFVKSGEEPRDAAVRELYEELHVAVTADALALAWQDVIAFEHRKDNVTIFETTADAEPLVRIDGREVIWAGFERPEDALRRHLLPHVGEYLSGRGERTSSRPTRPAARESDRSAMRDSPESPSRDT